MDPSHARNYQRAVTPTIDKNGDNGVSSAGSLIRGKTLLYQNQNIRSKIATNVVSAEQKIGYQFPQRTISNLPNSQSSTPQQKFVRSSIAGSEMNIQGRTPGLTVRLNDGNTIPHEGNIITSLPRFDLVPLSDEIPPDGIIFSRIRNQADTLVVFRTVEERSRNPERLNLDRRQLEICPILEQEQRLRLLNFQNNNIREIANLDNLPNLIFLDMYNNRLTSLEGPVSSIKGLRVLMAGKNKISAISNISSLKKLDVLDLHSNEIRVIEGLDGLNELRVLNLAGNRISIVNNLSSLQSLTELNLRRNMIEKVLDLDMIPSLQRVFLSHNSINSFVDISCLYNVKMLIELSLDGNPISSSNAARYRQRVIAAMPYLRHLDLKRISDEEKAQAVESCIGVSPIDPIDSSIVESSEVLADSKKSGRNTPSPIPIDLPVKITPPSEPAPVESLTVLSRTGRISHSNELFELEIIGKNEKSLIIVGENWDWIPNKRVYCNVVEVSLCYVSLNTIINKFLPNILWIPLLRSLRFLGNQIECIRDLVAIGDLLVDSIEEISIQNNSILMSGLFFEEYLIFKLPKLSLLNGKEISTERRQTAQRKCVPLFKIAKLSKDFLSTKQTNKRDQVTKKSFISVNGANITGSNPLRSNRGPAWDEMTYQGLMMEVESEVERRRSIKASFDQVFESTVKQIIFKAVAGSLSS